MAAHAADSIQPAPEGGAVPDRGMPLFDRIVWKDPASNRALDAIVTARTPAGVPISGALRIRGTDTGYPIVDCVARLTPELANRHASWLTALGLRPPDLDGSEGSVSFQDEDTVESFGWQWTWNSEMRSDEDLRHRVLEKYRIKAEELTGAVVLDAGAGAGDQSRFLLRHDASVISIDLSSAIDVVARKLRMNGQWFGVQGDITMLPFAAESFDLVYCEGVIQHTRDSVQTVQELVRVTRSRGRLAAAHYIRLEPRTRLHKLRRKLSSAYYERLRRSVSRLDRFKMLLVTGNLAALSYVPLLGSLLRRTGTAYYSDLMPGLHTTWTNTFDMYGAHAYQRFLTPAEFNDIFAQAGGTKLLFTAPGLVLAEKIDRTS